jgi:hypothetical protein
LSVAISQDERGRQLEDFFDCLESTRVRLIDRTEQRAIGETILDLQGSKLRTITYIEFIRRAGDPEVARWLEPLRLILVRAWHTAHRQKLLQYLTVLHALVDTLDPKHLVTGSPDNSEQAYSTVMAGSELPRVRRLSEVRSGSAKVFGPPTIGAAQMERRREGVFWHSRGETVRSLRRL